MGGISRQCHGSVRFGAFDFAGSVFSAPGTEAGQVKAGLRACRFPPYAIGAFVSVGSDMPIARVTYGRSVVMTVGRRAGAAALVAAGLLGFGISGCSAKDDHDKGDTKASATNTPSISAEDLQKSLASRISTATPPKSVTCASGLTGEVGKTATCEVVVNDTTSVQAITTVTKVDGGNIDYDFAPSMTKAQLEKAFAANVSAEVTCDAGLEGKVGSSTTCHVTKDGTTDDTAVSVSKVQGLYMSLSTSQS